MNPAVRTTPEDPNRCKGAAKFGQCPNAAEHDIDDDGILFEVGVDDDGAHLNSFADPQAVFIENDINPPTPNSDAEMLDPDNFSAHAAWVPD